MASVSAAAKANRDKNGAAGKTVLIADDEKDIRRILAEQLREHKVKVIHAARGREALRSLEKMTVDCAVLDILMPDDGIETAKTIQRKYPQLPILFLTGYGDRNRKRSAEEGVWVERWIDKGPDWPDKAPAIILETLRRPRVSQISKAISHCVLQNHIDIDTDAIYAIASSLVPVITSEIALAPIHSPDPDKPLSDAIVDPPPPRFEDVLNRLRVWFEELRAAYEDPAQRRKDWMQFRRIVTEQLWVACEPLAEERDKYRQQLADQFDRAIRKIKPTDDHNLLPEHIRAIALSLERLSSDKVDADDVHECKKAWQLARVETLPSLGEILRKWEKPYANETGTDEQEED